MASPHSFTPIGDQHRLIYAESITQIGVERVYQASPGRARPQPNRPTHHELAVDKHGLTPLILLGPARLVAAESEMTGPASRQIFPNLTRLSELGRKKCSECRLD